MIPLIDNSSVLGLFFQEVTRSFTGSLFLTVIFVLIMFFALMLFFKIPFEVGLIITFPFILLSLFYTTQLILIFGIYILYFSLYIAKNWFFN